jgi:hypothetical protein
MRSIVTFKTATVTALVCAAAAVCLTSAAVAAGNLTELPKLPNNDVNPPALKAGVTFQASSFPLAMRATAPDATWFGGQGKIVTKKRGSFGWVEFLQSPPASPRGAISMITSLDATPSVAATVAQLRTGGSGATYQATVPARLAGFSGRQFDGQVVGKNHIFVPFSPLSHAATFHPDAYKFDRGEVFRIIVLDVRGKTVVLLLENVALPADQFTAFLSTAASRLLGSLQFPV